MKKILSILLLSGCASAPTYIPVKPIPFKNPNCVVKFTKTISAKKANHLNRCQVKSNGKSQYGLLQLDGTVLLPPRYDEIVYEASFSKGALIKSEGDKTYKIYDATSGEIKESPIAYLRPGKFLNGLPYTPHPRNLAQYSAPLSADQSTFYVLDEKLNILKEIPNVDTNKSRELTFPAVHSFHSFNTFWMKHSTRLIRHNLNGKVYYQAYDALGEKIGEPLDYDKVTYLQVRATKSEKSPFNVTPWVHKGGDLYMPLLHYHYNLYIDPTSDQGDFLGVIITKDKGPETKTYSGATLITNHDHKFLKALVFRDEKGLYYTKESHDLQAKRAIPKIYFKKLKEDPNNFYRSETVLPFIPGKLTKEGNPLIEEVTVYEKLDGKFEVKVEDRARLPLGLHDFNNTFDSITAIEDHFIKRQQEIIAEIRRDELRKIKYEEDMRKEEEFQRGIEEQKRKAAVIMASSWGERDRKEKEHKEKLERLDREEKNKKPNPLLNLDIKKIFDTEGAKRRAACTRKMTETKKAFVSGKQGWYYDGKCK